MRLLKRVLLATACATVVAAAAVALGVWLIARDEVAAVRSARERATVPLDASIRNAIVAAEDPVLVRPRFSLRAFVPASGRRLYCGPPHIAYTLVRPPAFPQQRPLRRHVESAVATYVVAWMFDPEDLLRVYANELYLGRVEGRDVRGVEAASRVYFGKTSRDLTTAEAATLAAMVRSPNYYSPRRHPARSLERRNKVLERMLRARFIDEAEYRRAVGEVVVLAEAR